MKFEAFLDVSDVETAEVELPNGAKQTLGSVSSADILEWLEENKDPQRNKLAGLRLLVKSWVNDDGTRIGEGLEGPALQEAREVAVQALSNRKGGAKTNGLLVKASLEVNGILSKKAADPNGSSETGSDGSPTGSQSPQVH